MDLKLKFVEADVCDVIKVNQMEVGRKYPISRARQIDTKYGESVLLTILGLDEKLVCFCQRYILRHLQKMT